jgi:hypothetical protein
MASIKYLSEFYTFKAYIPAGRIVEDASSPLETKVQVHVLLGNQLYAAGKYTAALGEYLTAWGLLPKIVHSRFPDYAVAISPESLLKLDLVDPLVNSAVDLHLIRTTGGYAAPVVGLGDPPDELLQLSVQYGGAPSSAADLHYQRGVAFAAAGQQTFAAQEYQQAARLAGNDQGLQLDVQVALAALDATAGNFGAAQERFGSVAAVFTRLGQTDKAAAMRHNAAVAQTLSGDDAGASQNLKQSASLNPAGLNWTVTHSMNPGIAAFDRPMGTQGLPLLVSDRKGSWVQFQVAQPAKAQTVSVLKDNGAIQINLQANAADSIRTQLLEPRVQATTLSALDTYYFSIPQFITYLAHVSGFILPLAIGDTYSQLGDYDRAATFYLKARDYKYLNIPIERPMVWTRVARMFVLLGNRLYRGRDIARARVQYEKIVKIAGGAFTLTGDLYSGGFAPVQAETLAFLNAADKVNFTAMDYARRAVIMEALNNLNQILQNINYLGFPEDFIPIYSWQYLQNIARYLANQAIQAERNYINFKNSAEQEEANQLLLEQSVDASAAATAVELQRVQATIDQKNVADLSAEAAQTRLDNAVDRKSDYDSTSQQLAVLDEITAWATGPMDEAEVSQGWANALGISPGDYDTYQVTRYASKARSKISRGYELRNMDRQISEMQDSVGIANAQVTAAQSMVNVAQAQEQLAELRQQQAQGQLDNFNAQEFTPELWSNLANAQRQISQRYLDWAISAAFLMERAFEFEFDIEVNRIRFDYSRSDLHGLLSGEFLLADGYAFTYDRLLDTQKKGQLKVVIPLADRYPFQFFQQFQKTGRMEFDTLLEDFDRMHPGAHLRKLRRVEVVVEGLIVREGAQGFLRNSGFSFFRGRDGFRRTRVQKPEVMPLSLFDVRRDGFLFTTQEGVLQLFENSGVATGWTIEFPPDSNNLDYRTISNLNLVLYFDAYYSDKVANVAIAELEAGAFYQQTLGLALRFQFPDEFFLLQDTNKVTFEVSNNYLPFNQTLPVVATMQVAVTTAEGVSNAGLVVNIRSQAGAVNISQTTDSNGMISTGTAAEPLNAVFGKSLEDTWTVEFDPAANAAAFAAGFSGAKVTNVFLNNEYDFTPRGRLETKDDFSADTLADFDVVDDSGACIEGPSVWQSSANLGGSIEQTSKINGGTQTTDPVKPGTYLVHKTSPQWPNLQDLTVRCHLRSSDDGAIGLVFRYLDADNFYFFLIDRQRQYRRIGKKVAGVFHELDTPAVQTGTAGFELDTDYEISVAAKEDAFAVCINGALVLSGRDGSALPAGRVGLYAWDNTGASFLDLAIRPI